MTLLQHPRLRDAAPPAADVEVAPVADRPGRRGEDRVVALELEHDVAAADEAQPPAAAVEEHLAVGRVGGVQRGELHAREPAVLLRGNQGPAVQRTGAVVGTEDARHAQLAARGRDADRQDARLLDPLEERPQETAHPHSLTLSGYGLYGGGCPVLLAAIHGAGPCRTVAGTQTAKR